MDFKDIVNRGKDRGIIRLTEHDCWLLDKTSREICAKTILEIGSQNGTSSMVLGSVAKDLGGHLYCVEACPTGIWRENIVGLQLTKCVTLIKASSPWVDMSLINTPIDYLFIDGEHRTRWCLVDYHYWFPFVRKGGRIAFHDIYGPPSNKVWRAVNLILEDDAYPGREKIKEVERIDPKYASEHGGVLVWQKTV